MGDVLNDAIFEIAEELSESMGLCIPAPDLVKVAGAMVTTEALKHALDLLIPSASTAMSFSTTGITLAFIQRKLREITRKIDTLLDVSRKAAKDKLTEALTSLEFENYADAFEAFSKASDKATEGFHSAQDHESRVACTKIKLFATLMIKCYDKNLQSYLPFTKLSSNKKTEVASLMKISIDALIDELRNGRDNIDLMDVIMFKSGVKKKMLQVRLNELFSSSYRFLSEGLGWTSPEGIIDEQGDVLRIEVYPEYLPIGDEDDSLALIIGKGKTTKMPLTLSVHRILLEKAFMEKRKEKLIVEKYEFTVDCTFDNQLMIEIFSGKIAVIHDPSMLFIEAARVGRTFILESMLESNPDDIDVNRKNFRQESALILAAKNSHTSSLSFLYSLKNIDPFITDGKGNTALHFMAIKNDKNVVDIILNKYKDLDLLNAEGESPLSFASSNGHTNLVQALVHRGCKINHQRQDGCTPLFLASMNSHPEVVKYLMKNKADHRICRNSDQASPIWVAAYYGHLEIIKLFINKLKKSDLRLCNAKGVTPARAAAENEHINVYMVLDKKGAI